MKTVFNTIRNIFAVLGLILSIALVIVIDFERAAEIREYFQLDTLYDETM